MNTPEIGDVQSLLNHFFRLNNYEKIAILVDDNTGLHCLPKIKDIISNQHIVEIKSGENHKTLDTCVGIWEHLTNNNFSRKDLLINLGGGVIGDMGGFCAATYKRGIDFINIPTTLLSMVDASMGGKLGIDFFELKNHIGLFKDPNRVLIDQSFLATLPSEELKSGYAEVIKHALIMDRPHWDSLSKSTFSDLLWQEVIAKSISIKESVVMEDPLEGGKRKILNFGHTIGHALESFMLKKDSPILHGEGVAAGMIMEAWLSTKLCGLDDGELNRIVSYIDSEYSRIHVNQTDHQSILNLMLMDKKNLGNKMLFSLLEQIGSAVYDIEVNEQLVIESFEFYNSN